MKIYVTEVEYERLEPREDSPQRYDFEALIEVDEPTVIRWRQAIHDYDRAQAEMKQIHRVSITP